MDRNLTVRRLKRTGSTNLSAYSSTGTVWQCSFQDTEPPAGQLSVGQIGKDYSIFIDDPESGIKAGDEIVVNSRTYAVSGVSIYDFGGGQYTELTGTLKN